MSESKNNNALYLTIIGILVVIIIVGAFFVGKNAGNKNGGNEKGNNGSEISQSEKGKDITITIIDDKRCTNCMTDKIASELKKVPFLSNAKYIQKEFSEKGVEGFIKDNGITKLPAIILSTKDISDDGKMKPYLKELKNKEYSLEIGANFDPFAKRSAKGFLLLDKEVITKIKENSFVKGNKDAKITWLEFSDLECPYCAKLHNSGVPEKIEEKYKDNLNVIFNHFPLEFHDNAMPGARIAECLAKETSGDKFYALIKTAYKEEKSSKDFLIGEAVKLGAKKETLEKCVENKEFDKKITAQQSFGATTFGITGTPGNVLINNITGEYEVLSGALPYEAFESTIDSLLK